MNKKLLALFMSFILLSSLGITVKADETKKGKQHNLLDMVNTNEITTAIEEKKVETSEDNSLTSDKGSDQSKEHDAIIEDLPLDFTFFIGDEFKKQHLINQIALDESFFIDFISPLDEGIIESDSAGIHPIILDISDNLGNIYKHNTNIIITGRPVIIAENNTVIHGDVFTLDLLKVKAQDYEDGDLSDSIKLLSSEVGLNQKIDNNQFSSFDIILSVKDSDHHETSHELTVNIETPQVMMTKNAFDGDTTTTISGKNRYQTATAISQKMYLTSELVILVSSQDFPDALAAGPLSASLNAPILLTDKESLSSSTENEIKRLGSSKVIIMGGEGAISKNVENTLLKENIKTERISGSNRYATALETAKKLNSTTTVVLANGNNFADAMTAGSYASIHGYPIILSKDDKLTETTNTFILDNTENIIIMGGETAISKQIQNHLTSKGKTVTRISGSNRYNTSVKMAEHFFSNSTIAVVANGLNFVDALSAVPYSASLNAPILLTKTEYINEGVTNLLLESKISNFHFIGGESVVSSNVKNSMIYPSLSEVNYKTADLVGNWSTLAKNGQTSGEITSKGISLFDIKLSGSQNLIVRYGVSVSGLGWQSIKENGPVGISGKPIDGLIMELKGTDSKQYDIFYRAYLKNSGWSSWTLGGNPVGKSGGEYILAIETRIIKGNGDSIDKNLFPANPIVSNYAYTTSSLNLRSAESSSSRILLSMPNRSHLDIVSVNSKTNWAKVNYSARGIVHTGYAHMAYIRQEKHKTNAIITLTGLNNGDSIPKDTVILTGDASYYKGISKINYYINGEYVGEADYGYLSSESIPFGFTSPVKTGFHISIPPNQWKPSAINSIKVEIVGLDGVREWDSRYIGGSNNDVIVTNQYHASFNYYVNTEALKGSAHYGKDPASTTQLSKYMDPNLWIAHDTYKYMFLDLGYSPSDYTVTVKQLDDIIKGKGVLDGMGQTFLSAATDFNINPFYLIAHAILETGNGRSVLANGQTLSSYHQSFGKIDSPLIPLSKADSEKKWYNMYGIGAYDGNAALWGGEKAYHEGWDSIEKAIYGGAEWIANGYINRSPSPQNTNYTMRYNLKETMSHQYATDIMWAYKQASNIKKQFDGMGVDVPLRFIVPTFSGIRP